MSPTVGREEREDAEEADPYAETADEPEDVWDRPETMTEGEVAA